MIFSAFLAVCFFANLGDLRSFLGNPFKKTSAKAANFGVEKIYNREQLYKKIETTVIALSKSKTGAIITFEKNRILKSTLSSNMHQNLISKFMYMIPRKNTQETLNLNAVKLDTNSLNNYVMSLAFTLP